MAQPRKKIISDYEKGYDQGYFDGHMDLRIQLGKRIDVVFENAANRVWKENRKGKKGAPKP